MGAYDQQLRKVTVQSFYVAQPPMFDVDHYDFRLVSREFVPQLLAGSSEMHREMRAKATGQGVGQSGILLENNYTLGHISPDLQPVVNGGRQRSTRAAGVVWENHDSTDI
jgi:hypothetical protein